jgi:hypothetical protein
MRFAILIVPLAACAPNLDFNFDLNFDHEGPQAHVLDDGVSLHIGGCPDGKLLGCNDLVTGDHMDATIDGQTVVVPVDSSPVTNDESALLLDDPFRLSVPSPADPQVDLIVDNETVTATIPSPFWITRPHDGISRGAGPVTIFYEALASADTFAMLDTTCGTNESFDSFEPTKPGQIAIDLGPSGAGTCSHKLKLIQEVTPAERKQGAIGLLEARAEVVTFSSAP